MRVFYDAPDVIIKFKNFLSQHYRSSNMKNTTYSACKNVSDVAISSWHTSSVFPKGEKTFQFYRTAAAL